MGTGIGGTRILSAIRVLRRHCGSARQGRGEHGPHHKPTQRRQPVCLGAMPLVEDWLERDAWNEPMQLCVRCENMMEKGGVMHEFACGFVLLAVLFGFVIFL